MNSGLKQFHLHLVSDATGETINSVARACVAQFDQVQPIEHFWNLVRTTRQLEMVIEGIKDNPGLVMFTLVDEKLRRRSAGDLPRASGAVHPRARPADQCAGGLSRP